MVLPSTVEGSGNVPLDGKHRVAWSCVRTRHGEGNAVAKNGSTAPAWGREVRKIRAIRESSGGLVGEEGAGDGLDGGFAGELLDAEHDADFRRALIDHFQVDIGVGQGGIGVGVED